jgi:D-serine/D-alanine/glycine transporter
MPGGVPMAWFSLAFLRFALCLLALRPDTRIALLVMPGWFIWLAIAYQLTHSRKLKSADGSANQYRDLRLITPSPGLIRTC